MRKLIASMIVALFACFALPSVVMAEGKAAPKDKTEKKAPVKKVKKEKKEGDEKAAPDEGKAEKKEKKGAKKVTKKAKKEKKEDAE